MNKVYNLSLSILITLFSFTSHAQGKISDHRLVLSCFSKEENKKLDLYESKFADVDDYYILTNMKKRTKVKTIESLTISGNEHQVFVWKRPNGHGGASLSFHAFKQNEKLVGEGLGIGKSECKAFF